MRHLHDLIARRRDANMDGDCLDAGDATFYAVTDVQFSVVAMLTSTGKLHERVAYDSYGTAHHHWKDDVDGDGDVDSSDKSAVTALLNKAIYQSGYNPAADIDRSGTIDSADASLVSSKVIAALPAGEVSDRTAAGPDNTIGYDGYVFNPENFLYTVRFRHYDTGLGRWLERDPAGYVDGANLYQASLSDPLDTVDWLGLCACSQPEKKHKNIIVHAVDDPDLPSEHKAKTYCKINTVQDLIRFVRKFKLKCEQISWGAHGDAGVFASGAITHGMLDARMRDLNQLIDEKVALDCGKAKEFLDWYSNGLGALKDHTDALFLFACNVGQGDKGKAFVQELANWTGITIKAPRYRCIDLGNGHLGDLPVPYYMFSNDWAFALSWLTPAPECLQLCDTVREATPDPTKYKALKDQIGTLRDRYAKHCKCDDKSKAPAKDAAPATSPSQPNPNKPKK